MWSEMLQSDINDAIGSGADVTTPAFRPEQYYVFRTRCGSRNRKMFASFS